MLRLLSVLALALASALPAVAAEEVAAAAEPRLVVGRTDFGAGFLGPETRTEILEIGGFSVGALTAPAAPSPSVSLPEAELALGGFVAYHFDRTLIETSLRRDGEGTKAGLSAGYHGRLLDGDSRYRLRFGAAWEDGPSQFSVNPARAGEGNGVLEPDLSLSLDWRHAITPSLSFTGAASVRGSLDPLRHEDGTFAVGAGLGLRF